MPTHKSHPFLLILLILFLGQTLSNVFQRGLFMDGLIYASIAKNMAHNIGDFYNPVYLYREPFFHSHPPMMFFLQSIFFRVFGDSFWVEKLYSFFVGCLIIASLCLIFLTCLPKKYNYKRLMFIAPSVLFLFPLSAWSIRSNIIEPTQTLFLVIAVLFFFKSIDRSASLYWSSIVLGSIFIFLALLTKGLTALFPLSFFILHDLVYKRKITLTSIKNTVLVFIFISFAIITIYLISESSRLYIDNYWQVQISESLKGSYRTVDSRFQIVIYLFQQAFIPLILMVSILMFKGKKFIEMHEFKNEIILFLFIGFSASFPIMISLKQAEFYLFPSFPFFALSLSFFCLPALQNIDQYFSFRSLRILQFVLIAAIVIYSFSQQGNAERDQQLLVDLDNLFMTQKHNKSKIALVGDNTHLIQAYSIRYFEYEFSAFEEADYTLKMVNGRLVVNASSLKQ